MAQNTNAIAGLKLQPNKSNGVGRIVEEHIRYWRKTKSEEEAEINAKKARQQEFNYKKNNKSLELLEGITPKDSKGFLNSQIIDAFEKKKPLIKSIIDRINAGDSSAVLEYSELKEKFARLSNVNELYGKKSEEYAKDEANYNPILDKGKKDFNVSTSKNLYFVNDDLGFDVMINGRDEPLKISSSELYENEYLTGSYSGKAKFKEYGVAVAANLLKNNGDPKDINNLNKGILQIKSIFNENNIEARSAYGVYVEGLKEKKEEELTDFEKTLVKGNAKFSDLTSVQVTKVAEDYYKRNVDPFMQQAIKNDAFDKAMEKERLEGQKLLNKGRRTDNEKKEIELSNLKNKTDSKGSRSKDFKVEAQTDQKGRLARTTNINGDDAVVFGGFKAFEVIEQPETFGEGGVDEEKIEIEELILTDDGDLSYRQPNGREGINSEVIDRIVNYLGYDDVKDLFEQMKENRDIKLNKVKGKGTDFDPTKF